MATDTSVSNLVINKMTKAQYDSLVNPSATELYLVPDEMDITPTSGSTNPVTSNGIYNAISGLAQDSAVVHITGNEQIGGIKTFDNTIVFNDSISINNNQNKGVYINSEFDQINNELMLNLWGDNDEKVRLGNIEEPRNDTDAATKYYVDHHGGGGGGGSYDGNSYVFYGTCTTAAATVAKVVVCSDFTSSDLVEGVMVIVKFSVKNTGAVANLTLNVNGTGPKGIRKIYTTSGVTTLTNAAELAANAPIPFIYNGTYWVVAGLDYNSYYVLSATTYKPLMDGTASAGTSSACARQDHVHPTDTSRAANTDFVGSDDGHIGTHGLVPAPSMSSAPKILTSDRTSAWQTKDSLDIASKTYVDNMIGDIETLLAAI